MKFGNNWLTEEIARGLFKNRFRSKYNYSKYVPNGFYSKCLNFSEWLDYYHIKLL
jgi:hypothetical protein